MKNILIGLSSLLLIGTVMVGAQDRQEGGSAPAARPPAGTPLKMHVVLSRFNGDRKVSSAPYSMMVMATQRTRDMPVSLRMGVQVPVANAPSKDGPTSYNYRNVGTNIDCWATAHDGGRFMVAMSVEQSSLYGDSTQKQEAQLVKDAPIFRTFNTNVNMILKDGESSQFVSAADPLSGEVLKIDVTLNVVK